MSKFENLKDEIREEFSNREIEFIKENREYETSPVYVVVVDNMTIDSFALREDAINETNSYFELDMYEELKKIIIDEINNYLEKIFIKNFYKGVR